MKLKPENAFYLISPTGRDRINYAIANLPGPGGLVRIYDEDSQSVVVIGIDKRNGEVNYVGWSVYGPVDHREAAKLISEVDAGTPGLSLRRDLQ